MIIKVPTNLKGFATLPCEKVVFKQPLYGR